MPLKKGSTPLRHYSRLADYTHENIWSARCPDKSHRIREAPFLKPMEFNFSSIGTSALSFGLRMPAESINLYQATWCARPTSAVFARWTLLHTVYHVHAPFLHLMRKARIMLFYVQTVHQPGSHSSGGNLLGRPIYPYTSWTHSHPGLFPVKSGVHLGTKRKNTETI